MLVAGWELLLVRSRASGTGLPLGLDRVVSTVPVELQLAAPGHLALTLGALAVLMWWWWRGRVTPRSVIDLNTIWAVSLLALVAVTSKLTAFASLGSDATANGVAIGGAFVGVLGPVSRSERDWAAPTDRHVALYAAWALAFIAILVADELDPSWRLDQQMAVQVFEGMFTLGLPLAIHGRLAHRTPAASRVPALAHITLLVAGHARGSGPDADRSCRLAVAVGGHPAWLVVLLVARWRHPAWDRLGGTLAGAMLAAGTTLYWRLPTTFCVPFRPAFPSLETLSLWSEARRTLGFDAQLAVTLGGLALGALCGWLVFAGGPGPGASAVAAPRLGVAGNSDIVHRDSTPAEVALGRDPAR